MKKNQRDEVKEKRMAIRIGDTTYPITFSGLGKPHPLSSKKTQAAYKDCSGEIQTDAPIHKRSAKGVGERNTAEILAQKVGGIVVN